MKKNLLTLVIVGVIVGIGYYFLTKGPTRDELVFAGNYQSFETMSGSIDSEKITVLDFYAPRCPSCRTAHKNILDQVSQLPTNLQILNVDYDSNKDLRMKYGVTSQHTFVLVDRQGNKIKSIQGLNHVAEIVDFVGSDLLNPITTEIVTEVMTGDNQNLSGIQNIQSTKDSSESNLQEPVQAIQSVGIYTDYEGGKKYISDSNKKVVLFFHASRCPSCIQADKDIVANQNTIDSNMVILKVDYDTATDLKKKYEITTQTSYVLLNADGTLAKKTIGLTSLDAIKKFIQ